MKEMRGCIFRLLVFAVVAAAGTTGARAAMAGADPVALLPDGTRLGMERREILARSPPLRRLDPPIIFGPLLGEFLDRGFSAMGAPGLVYYQLDPTTGRLRQLLFEWRDGLASRGRAAEMMAELESRLGPPAIRCVAMVKDAPPRLVTAHWAGEVAALNVALFDFRASGIAYFDLNTDSDPRQPSHERRRITRRSLPRRLIARLHAVGDAELNPRRECPAGSLAHAG